MTTTTAEARPFVIKVSFLKEVEYDHWEHGAGVKADGTVDTSRWGIDIDFANTVLYGRDSSKFEVRLANHLQAHGMPELKNFCIFPNLDEDKARLSANIEEDDYGAGLDADECKRLHHAGKQLYLANYEIILEFLPEERMPTVGEMKELLPSLHEY